MGRGSKREPSHRRGAQQSPANTPAQDRLDEIPVEVRTPRGALAGRRSSDGRSLTFRGVPYALPPVGELRWRAPVPTPSWSGVLDAHAFGPVAIQPRLNDDAFYADNPPLMSEDCLSLNIWAPTGARGAPVMVWLHGGNLVFGAGSNARYDGMALSRLGVIVVTINYRLGVFGYFAHPALSAESRHGVSGNYGTLDQIEALRWVGENIAAFGGDPGKVTVFGQSAGALSVTQLMASPLARGLFHRAIAMSPYLPAMPQLKAETLGQLSAEELGEAFGDAAGAKSLADLRALDGQALLARSRETQFVIQGVIDGWVHPTQIFDTFATGAQTPVPLLIGFTGDETRSLGGQGFLPATPKSSTAYRALVRRLYGDLSERFLAQYPADDPDNSLHAATRDAFYARPAMRIARDHAANSAPTYLYAFQHTYRSATEMGVGAFHSSDVPFVFGNVGDKGIAPVNWPAPPRDATDLAVSDAMMAYWTAFARDGRPAASGLPDWPRYTGASGDYMRFAHGGAMPSRAFAPGMFELNEDIVAARRAANIAWWRWENMGLCLQGVNAPLLPQH